jgi:hypothetical protein
MITEIGSIVAQGFIVGITIGTITFIVNWVLSCVMNIFKIPTKGE